LSRGNDANDVLHIVFLGMPTDMEGFVQEAGRCGRKQLGFVSVLASPERLHLAFTLARKCSLGVEELLHLMHATKRCRRAQVRRAAWAVATLMRARCTCRRS
jgi:superfamily II DNA helicase RecQ